MTTPILTTKLYIPSPTPDLVPRMRLIEQLNTGFFSRLTLISAPAGFGKSTLLSAWVEQAEARTRVAWLSLDPGDNDLTRFLAYFIAALQTIESNIGKGLLAALQSPGAVNVEGVLTSLLNEITEITDDVVIILDDYQVIETQPIDQAITYLLDHLSTNMHLFIATRTDPPLPLARLRGGGQLTELRTANLRFTQNEAAAFLNQVMGLGLSAEDIAALETRTEGWIVGLQLAALSLQEREDPTDFIRSFTGSHHHILDYLVEEVLRQQSPSTESFLLQTSILERLTGPLCDAVCTYETDDTDQNGGQATLERLAKSNLFIVPLDDERCWYRYHHLFADLLQARLRRFHSDQIKTLHLNAVEWFEKNGMITDAVNHAFSARDYDRAAQLIEAQANTLWERGAQTKLLGWLEALPAEQVFARPHLCIFHAWGLYWSGQQNAAEECLQAAEEVLDERRALNEAPGILAESDQMKLRGRVAVTRAFMASYRGDVHGIIQFSRQALEYLPEHDYTWRSNAAISLGDAYSFKGDVVEANQVLAEAVKASKASGNVFMALVANLKYTIILRQHGQLPQAIEICKQQLKAANKSGLAQTAIAGWLFAIWGDIRGELNNLDGAIHYAKKGVELTEQGNNIGMLGWSYLCLIRVLFFRGDFTSAEEIINKVEKLTRESDIPPWVTHEVTAWKVRIWLSQGHLTAASQWAQKHELDLRKERAFLYENEQMALVRLFIAQNRALEATEWLDLLITSAREDGRISRVIEMLVIQTLALQADGKPAQAMSALKQALTLAEPGGYLRIFLNEGAPMAKLLSDLLEIQRKGQGDAGDEISSAFVHKLLSAFGSEKKPDLPAPPAQTAEPERAGDVTPTLSPSLLTEPLTDRELEVLRLIADGLTYAEIASQILVSLNTVRTHVKNIYRKLFVHKRSQAIAKAKELNIL